MVSGCTALSKFKDSMHMGATGDLVRSLVLRGKERKLGSWASRHPYTGRKGQQRIETGGREASLDKLDNA